MSNINIFSLFLLAIFNLSVFSQKTNQDTSNIKIIKIDEVVIESNKNIPYNHEATIISVIQNDEIKAAAVENLQDLLEYVQGIDIRSRSTEGVQADANIRGGTFDQTIVLLNGINFTDPQTGHHSLNIPIDINSIERIELIQGIGSWFAGTPSFCGAINIITKDITSTNANANFTYGMYDYMQAGLSGETKINDFKASLSANATGSNGYEANTDFKIYNIYFNSKYASDKLGNFELQAGYQDKAFGANSFYSPAYPEQYEQTRAIITSLHYNKNWLDYKANLTAYFRQHNDQFELYRWNAPDGYTPNYHQTDVWGINASGDYKWNLGTTTFGADFRSEYIKSSTLGEPISVPQPISNETNAYYKKDKLRLHENAYLQHRYVSGKWDIQLGLMGAGNNDYGFKLYSGGNFSYFFDKKLNVQLSSQHSYRLPTFTDLYSMPPPRAGNSDLKPEEAINTNFSVNWHHNALQLHAGVLYRYSFDVIDWVRLPDETIWHAENMANITTLGFDISGQYNFDFFINKIKFNYSYLDVNNSSNINYFSLYAMDYLRHQIKINIYHEIWHNLDANWQFNFQDRAGSYADQTNNMIDYKPYLLCDLKLTWQAKAYSIFVMASNLFDTKYEDIGNLPQPGIWAKAGVSVNNNIFQ